MSSAAGYSVVPVQKIILPLRIIQLVFGLVVLGISAYHVYLYTGTGISYDAGGLGIFTGIATIIIIIYWFVATSPSGGNIYNYWAIFATELFVLIFWLCTFALVASKVALIAQYNINFSNYGSSGSTNGNGNGQTCYMGYCINYKRGVDKRAIVDPVSATLYTDLAVSVANFLLFSMTFTIYTINLFRHRAAMAGQNNGSPATSGHQANPSYLEKGAVATERPHY